MVGYLQYYAYYFQVLPEYQSPIVDLLLLRKGPSLALLQLILKGSGFSLCPQGVTLLVLLLPVCYEGYKIKSQ